MCRPPPCKRGRKKNDESGVVIPPEEQTLVLEVLKNVGVAEEMQFDNYMDAVNRYD